MFCLIVRPRVLYLTELKWPVPESNGANTIIPPPATSINECEFSRKSLKFH